MMRPSASCASDSELILKKTVCLLEELLKKLAALEIIDDVSLSLRPRISDDERIVEKVREITVNSFVKLKKTLVQKKNHEVPMENRFKRQLQPAPQFPSEDFSGALHDQQLAHAYAAQGLAQLCHEKCADATHNHLGMSINAEGTIIPREVKSEGSAQCQSLQKQSQSLPRQNTDMIAVDQGNGRYSIICVTNKPEEPLQTIDPATALVCNVMVSNAPANKSDASAQEVKKEEIPCLKCGATFSCQRAFNRHLSTHRDHTNVMLDEFSGLASPEEDADDPDVMVPTISESYSCDLCERTFANVLAVQQHKRKAHGVKREGYKCLKCGVQFSKRSAYKQHKEEAHGDDISPTIPNADLNLLPFFTCLICSLTFRTHNEFLCHDCRSSTDENKFSQSKNQRILITNIAKLRGLKKLVCTICREEYRSFGRMQYHLPRCQGPPYLCELCSAPFNSKVDLNAHKKKQHKGMKSFFCEECGLSFEHRTSLQKHIIHHHERKISSFPCDICNKKFPKKIHLTNHKLTSHSMERKYMCHLCGRKMSTTSALKVHMKVHTEEPSFQCGFCSKRYHRKDKLIHHSRLHTGERPFVCSACGKGFPRKAKLQEHMRRHKGEKRYHCTSCSKKYVNHFDLKWHIKKHHHSEGQSGGTEESGTSTKSKGKNSSSTNPAESLTLATSTAQSSQPVIAVAEVLPSVMAQGTEANASSAATTTAPQLFQLPGPILPVQVQLNAGAMELPTMHPHLVCDMAAIFGHNITQMEWACP